MSGVNLSICLSVHQYIAKTSFYTPPPHPCISTGGYIGITLSICSSVLVSDHVHSVSPEPLNHSLPNLVLWYIITSQCVMWKYWFTIFNVKVTARA